MFIKFVEITWVVRASISNNKKRLAQNRYSLPVPVLTLPQCLDHNQELTYPLTKYVLFPLQIYVEYAVKNPLCDLGEPIGSELFKSKLDEYVRALPIFATKIS